MYLVACDLVAHGTVLIISQHSKNPDLDSVDLLRFYD